MDAVLSVLATLTHIDYELIPSCLSRVLPMLVTVKELVPQMLRRN